MINQMLKFSGTAVICIAAAAQIGCACGKPPCVSEKPPIPPCEVKDDCSSLPSELTAALPPEAKPGECYAKVFIPPTFKTVSERVLVRDASAVIEVVPAKYEWVEEKVLVKDASTMLEVVPAEFKPKDVTIEVNASHTDWEINKNGKCANAKDEPAKDIFCLVNHPAEQRTLTAQNLVQPATVREVCVPAQYQTVRREKLVSAATTRHVTIPAEYVSVDRTVKVCAGRMAWKLVDCQASNSETVTINLDRTPELREPTNMTANAGRTRP